MVSITTKEFSARFATIACLFQTLLIVLFFVCTDYGEGVNVANGGATTMGFYYPMFQDVHIMIFIGFGFLMTFLRNYGMSATGYNMLLAALALQWTIFCVEFWHRVKSGHWEGLLELDVTSLIVGDFGAGAVLISFGAVLGKANPLQLCGMVFFELIFYAMDEMLIYSVLECVDMGGSMVVHLFGAAFGVGCSIVLSPKAAKSHELEGSTRSSDTFSMIGTIFLFCFWPSFNGCLAQGNQQHRVVINTVLALCASCTASFMASTLLRPDRKFSAVDIQNATLAGGVAVGSSSDLVIGPGGAGLIGSLAGFLCVVGFTRMQPYLASKGIHDTCGVMNLHGLSGFVGGIGGVFSSALVSDVVYGERVGDIFPARANGRTAGGQALYQLFGTLIALGIGVASGMLTGSVLTQPFFFPGGAKDDFFEDGAHWGLEEEEQKHITVVPSDILTPPGSPPAKHRAMAP